MRRNKLQSIFSLESGNKNINTMQGHALQAFSTPFLKLESYQKKMKKKERKNPHQSVKSQQSHSEAVKEKGIKGRPGLKKNLRSSIGSDGKKNGLTSYARRNFVPSKWSHSKYANANI